MPAKKSETYGDEESTRRVEKALHAAFNTPAKPQSEMKLGKQAKKPRKRAAAKAKGS